MSESPWKDLGRDIRRKQNNYVLIDRPLNKYIKIFLQFGTLAVLWHRFGRSADLCRVPGLRQALLALFFLLRPLVVRLSGIHIRPGLPIGRGFVIHNFSDIHLDAQAIGDNLTINQGVFIGTGWQGSGKPRVGNNVFIGSGAKILGAVTVGDNAVVAANALVVSEVPANSVVLGVPAVTIARDLKRDYLSAVPIHRRST